MTDKKQQVEHYLSKNGYPLEMYVAKQFSMAGFEVYQSSIYVDQETQKHRELDVAAYYSKIVNGVHLSFKVLIECKYASNSWIFFRGEHAGFQVLDPTNFYGTNYAGGKLLHRLCSIEEFTARNPFALRRNMGYGLTEAKEKNQENMSNPYKAVMTLLSALEYEKDESRNNEKTFQIFIPVIVLQGNLFECELNPANDVSVTEINEAQVLYKNNVFPGVYPLIEIITREKVPALANKLFDDLNSIATTHLEDIRNLITHFPQKTGISFL